MKRLLIALILCGCQKPVPTAPPETIQGRPAVPSSSPVWLDIDPSVGELHRDVDDGFALLQALNSPELAVRGVSIVFGNAELDRADPIGRELMAEWAPDIPVFTGADGPHREETDASRALADALRAEPMTVFALGPATNVATMLTHHPELAERIHAVVAVAGRYEGQRFTTGTTNGRSHRDFNFEKDSDAFRVLLDAKVELVLAPFEISRKVWVKQPYLQQLTGSRAARLIEPAGVWLQFWTDTFAVDGFNPFDTLAIAWLTRRDLITCDRRLANIEVLPDDRTEAAMQGTDVTHKPYLLVRQASEGNAGSTVTWCHDVQSEAFLEDLQVRLTR